MENTLALVVRIAYSWSLMGTFSECSLERERVAPLENLRQSVETLALLVRSGAMRVLPLTDSDSYNLQTNRQFSTAKSLFVDMLFISRQR
jgi:hypothetical protein